MQISATGKYLKISQKKMLLLTKSIKKMLPKKAINALELMNKNGADDLKKVILAAIANARKSNIVQVDNLVFKSIEVLKGTAMKRYRAVSRGMAHAYKKSTCHVRVILSVIKPEIKKTSVMISKTDNKNINEPEKKLLTKR